MGIITETTYVNIRYMQDILTLVSENASPPPLLGELLNERIAMEEQVIAELIALRERYPGGALKWTHINGVYDIDLVREGEKETLLNHLVRQITERLNWGGSVTVLDPFAGLGGTLRQLAERFPQESCSGKLRLIAWNVGLNIPELIQTYLDWDPSNPELKLVHNAFSAGTVICPTGTLAELIAYSDIREQGLLGSVDIVIERKGLIHTMIPDVWTYALHMLLKPTGIAYLHTTTRDMLERLSDLETEELFQARQEAFELGQGNLTTCNRQLINAGQVDIYASSEHLV